jgi:hypothetical protein
MKNLLLKSLAIATISTAIAGPSGGHTFSSLLGFGAGCPTRTPVIKLVFVSNPKNTGFSRIVTGYRFKGCIGKTAETMTCTRLRPRVLADDQKLTIGKKYAGAQTEVFLRGNYKFRNEE